MKRIVTLIVLVLVSLMLLAACELEDQSGSYSIKAEEGGTFEWSDVGTLEIPGGALSKDTQVNVSLTGEEAPFPEENPFKLIGDEVEIDLDGSQLNETLMMTLTLSEDNAPDEEHIIIARTYMPDGTPMALGTIREGSDVSFSVTGEGFYQLFAIESIDYGALADSIEELRSPLNVPAYPQVAPNWCSPTSLTMIAQYHDGAWPTGGTGSRWGETSSWYLTGLAHQPATSGNYFHNLLRAAGYNAPTDVRQDFSTTDMDVIIWNWNSVIYEFDTSSHLAGDADRKMADNLYDAFRAYAESYFWGLNGTRKPIAWGSGMIEHSRVLTGSDGTNLFYNESANGQQNVSLSWEDHHDAVMRTLWRNQTPEIIDTVVMLGEPRPEEARQGVIWLLPKTNHRDGSLVLRRIDGENREDVCYWYWDGSGTRTSGYYFDNHEVSPNPCASHPANTEFDHAFSIQDANYEFYYEFDVLNISDEHHSYLAAVEVEPAGGGTPILIDHLETANIAPKNQARGSGNYNLKGAIPLDTNLGAGRHTLKFTLWLDGVLQDTKYVFFVVEPFTAPLVTPTPEVLVLPTATMESIQQPTATLVPIQQPTSTPVPTNTLVPIQQSSTPEPYSCLNNPVLQAPADGAWVASSQPTLQWNYASLYCFPDNYTVQIATDAGMNSIVQSGQTEAKSYTPAPLTECTTYYWRVAGKRSGNMGPWSPVWSFSVGDPRSCNP